MIERDTRSDVELIDAVGEADRLVAYIDGHLPAGTRLMERNEAVLRLREAAPELARRLAEKLDTILEHQGGDILNRNAIRNLKAERDDALRRLRALEAALDEQQEAGAQRDLRRFADETVDDIRAAYARNLQDQ